MALVERRTRAPAPAEEPRIPPAARMDRAQFLRYCRLNRDARIERDSEGGVDGAAGLGAQAPHEAADLDDRAGIAALTDHLMDPRGPQGGVLRQGVPNERQ